LQCFTHLVRAYGKLVAQLKILRIGAKITITEIENSTGANRNTIKVHLKKLVKQHYLVQLGKGRGVRYTIK
jgi:Fic family protein